VQFPEDGVLGGGSEAQILEKLNGSDPGNLQGYYSRETVGRLHIVSTLAPLVLAPHTRSYYTVEGTSNAGYGLDVQAYPHNAQGLVEDVTRALADRIDFRLYDNTRDGIVDGLLILHSGPVSTETSAGTLPPDVLLAHSFTLPAPEARGGSLVFPYSVAATRDGIGVWAHEVGHLFGLPDLYVTNPVCVGPGLGEWSLMATGANRGGGANPTGLDAFSLQLLGIAPRFDDGGGVTLGPGVFVRATDPGEEQGPRYYLVQSRAAGDGPAGNTPARVVYLVNEDAVDNRVCPEPDYSPLVRVASVICPGDTACAETYYTSCPACPNVGFTFSGNHVRVTSGALPPVVLSRVQLGVPQMGWGGAEEQRVYLSFHNVGMANPHTVSIDVTAVNPDSVCFTGPSSESVTVAFAATAVDSSLSLIRCTRVGSVPRGELTLAIRTTEIGTTWSHADTLVLPANRVGLGWPYFCGYRTHNPDPARVNPWRVTPPICPECPCPGSYTAYLSPLAHGELVSPWFSVPDNGRLDLTHVWNLTALSPDVALDAGQVRLRRAVGDDIVLEPPLGWGYTAERGVGNALGGQPVLSGSGFRGNVFDLSEFSGDVAQIVLVAAGDSQSGGTWRVWPIAVATPPEITFSLESDPASPGTLFAATESPSHPGVHFILYRGVPGVAPTDTAFNGPWTGEPHMTLGHFDGPKSRFELVWTDSTGGAASTARIFDLPVPAEEHFLLAPSPNPVHHGNGQAWSIRVPDSGPPGTYVLRLISLDGGVRLERSVRIDLPGTRLIPWDGRDREGRTISSGIYFLEARRPDGVRNGQRVVVLP
jgi:M6 family metalloprotease-like protein